MLESLHIKKLKIKRKVLFLHVKIFKIIMIKNVDFDEHEFEVGT